MIPNSRKSGLYIALVLLLSISSASQATADCGDGTTEGNEECDDGNTRDGDGCSANCEIGKGWQCTGEPSACEWVPPIGIPKPTFGIEETHYMYQDLVGGGVYRDAGNGPYTYYIDNSVSCSDSNIGGFGSDISPRCTIPTSLVAGDVVEVHGGPYEFGAGGWTDITASGTQSQPVFIRGVGVDNEKILLNESSNTDFFGSYVVIENFEVANGRVRTYSNYFAIRHSHIHHHPSKTGVSIRSNYTVVYNNEINHHIGSGRNGVGTIPGIDYIWVLDNDIHHMGDDGLHFCNDCAEDPTEFVFIGRNVIYGNRENALDTKFVRHLVFSQNIAYGHSSSPPGPYCWEPGNERLVGSCAECNGDCRDYGSGSPFGEAITIGAAGVSPFNTTSEDIWIIFNEIRDNDAGIRNDDSIGTYWIGNRIYNIANMAFPVERSVRAYVYGNVIYDVGTGIDQVQQNFHYYHFFNNIFSNVQSGNFILIGSSPASTMTFRHNLLWNDGGPINIEWGTGSPVSYQDTADMDANFPGGTGNIIGDPRFMDATNFDFHLQSGSPAIDNGTLVTGGPLNIDELEAQYLATFGVPVNFDYDALPRPVGEWDIGAFEYRGGAVECTDNPDCADGNDCTGDICDAGLCGYINYNLDRSDTINLGDIIVIISHWGENQGDPGWDSAVDLNEDGNIGLADIIILISVWGAYC